MRICDAIAGIAMLTRSVTPIPDESTEYPCSCVDLGDRNELGRRVGQRDIAGAKAYRRNACLVEQGGIGPGTHAFYASVDALIAERL